MNANFLSPRMMFGAAIVGLVGAAGVFIYEQMYAEKRRTMLVQEVARLDKQVSSMRTELETLREVQKESQLRKAKQKKKRVRREAVPVEKTPNATGDMVDGATTEQSYASDSEYFTDYQSVAGTDREMDSDEFYDVHTDEDDDDTLRDSVRNGHLGDNVFDEDPSEKTDSPKKLPQNRTSDVLV